MVSQVDGFPMCHLNVTPKVYSGTGCFLIMLNCGLEQAAPSLLVVLGKILQRLGKRAGSWQPKGCASSLLHSRALSGPTCTRSCVLEGSLDKSSPGHCQGLDEGRVSLRTVVGLECLSC